jgi:hypothetical protein
MRDEGFTQCRIDITDRDGQVLAIIPPAQD